MNIRRNLRAVAVILAAWQPSPAQTGGSIEGLITDPAGAVVAGADVRIVEMQTGEQRKLRSDRRGRYFAPGLAPGLYRVEVTQPGFQVEVRRGFLLEAGRAIRADFQLHLGSIQDRLVVTAETPLVSISASDWGSSTGKQELESLPLNGRDLFDLAGQEPGATVPRSFSPDIIRGLGAHVSVNGARPNQNSYRLDGVYINDAAGVAPASSSGLLLGIEGIQELRLVTSPFSAEYGRAGGGALIAVSRSGSNEVHGAVYEYLRNSATDARNFFDVAGERMPPLKKNQFGALLSGPLRRDRLFLLGNYEGVRETLSQTERPLTLSAEARQGRLGQQTVAVSPQVRSYLDLYPSPNGADFGDGTAEFITELTRTTREDFASAKLNVLLSERWRSAVRYTFDDADRTVPDHFLIWNMKEESRYQMLHSDTQWVASPRTIHNFQFGFSRTRNDETAALINPSLASLEFISGRGLGYLNVTGLAGVGNSRIRQRPRDYFHRDYQFNSEVTHISGAQTWRMGAGFDAIRFDERSDRLRPGQYRFTSVADLLQGRTRNVDFMAPGSDSERAWRQRLFVAYGQHEVRFRRASLGLGVRYETYSVPTERDGKIATLRDPLRDAATTVGGPLYENPSRKNFAPRASVAWDPLGSGKTVIRAGAGLFFDLMGSKELLIAGVRMPPFFEVARVNGPPFPHPLDAGGEAEVRNTIDTLAFRPDQPYVIQYQFAVQRQLGAGYLAQVSYNGSRGVHLAALEHNINLAIPQTLADGRLFFEADASRFNPAWDSIGMRSTRFNSSYHSLNAQIEKRWATPFGYQLKYTWAKSLDQNSTLAFQDYDNTNRMPMVFNHRLNRGPSDFDVRHVMAANFSYSLPSGARPGIGWLLNGWEIHGLVQAQSGYYFSPTVGFDRARLQSGANDGGQRPDLVAPPGARIILGDPQRWFDPEAFGLPAPGFYGNLGRNVLAGPGLFNLDVAAHKTIYSTERQRVHLRIEWFNATNHPNFNLPEALSLFDSRLQRLQATGRIERTTTPARQLQFALRWSF